jgi:hypothetical protein
LAENKIIFTNAFTHPETGSPFTQPSIEFGPLEESPKKPLPKKTSKQAPAAKEVRIKYTDEKKVRVGGETQDIVPARTVYDENGNATIVINKKELQKKYEEKAWTKPKVKGVHPLSEDTFKSYEEWEAFVIGHEKGHVAEGPSKVKRGTPEYAEMENRMNQLGLKALYEYRIDNQFTSEELREKEPVKSDQPKVKKTNMFQSMEQAGLDPETLAEMKAEHTEAEAQQESTTTSVFGGLSNSTDNSELLEEMKAATESIENTSSEGGIDLSLFEGYKGATDGLKNDSNSNPNDTSEDNEFKDKCK